MNKVGPDFICIGAQASGANWLYQQLGKHPDFEFPNKKAILHFDRKHLMQSLPEGIERLIDVFRALENILDRFILLLSRLHGRYRKIRFGTLKKNKRKAKKKNRKIKLESDAADLSIFDTARITGDITAA